MTERIGLERQVLPTRRATTPDGSHHLLFADAGCFLQLCISEVNPAASTSLLVDALIAPSNLGATLNALACFNRFRATGRLEARYFLADPRGPRLHLVLCALDASLAGASHREVATLLVGHDRVRADWDDPGGHLRDRVRRAVRRGRALMNGGYREFLR